MTSPIWSPSDSRGEIHGRIDSNARNKLTRDRCTAAAHLHVAPMCHQPLSLLRLRVAGERLPEGLLVRGRQLQLNVVVPLQTGLVSSLGIVRSQRNAARVVSGLDMRSSSDRNRAEYDLRRQCSCRCTACVVT